MQTKHEANKMGRFSKEGEKVSPVTPTGTPHLHPASCAARPIACLHIAPFRHCATEIKDIAEIEVWLERETINTGIGELKLSRSRIHQLAINLKHDVYRKRCRSW
jgi:hypothetical protein